MIAELTPLHETRAGKEWLEEGIERGVATGVANLVRRMPAEGRTPAEIADRTDLSVAEITLLLGGEES